VAEQDSRKCSGHKTDGSPCPNWAMRGQKVCHAHGGRARQNKQAAALRLVEAEAAQAASILNALPVTDPLTALAELAGQVLAWRDKLATKVEEMTSYGYENYKAGEQIKADVALFERAMDRCVITLAAIARLRIDERLAKIEKKKVDLVADALAATLAELGIDQAVQHQAADGLERRLRLVAG
jgi:hypothetical protein